MFFGYSIRPTGIAIRSFPSWRFRKRRRENAAKKSGRELQGTSETMHDIGCGISRMANRG